MCDYETTLEAWLRFLLWDFNSCFPGWCNMKDTVLGNSKKERFDNGITCGKNPHKCYYNRRSNNNRRSDTEKKDSFGDHFPPPETEKEHILSHRYQLWIISFILPRGVVIFVVEQRFPYSTLSDLHPWLQQQLHHICWMYYRYEFVLFTGDSEEHGPTDFLMFIFDNS